MWPSRPSGRVTPAQRYGRALIREMAAQQRTNDWLAAQVMVSKSSVTNWRQGYALPEYASGLLVADALMSERLARLITSVRTMTCGRCEREFIAQKQLDARYCSERCRSATHWRAKNARKGERMREKVGSLLSLWEDVGERMCRQWCPNSGLCPDATCPIQEAQLCPLPLAAREAA